MKQATGPVCALAAGLLMGACGARIQTAPPSASAVAAAGRVVSHKDGGLICGANFDTNIDWSPGSLATRLRQRVVEAMVVDTITDATNGLIDPSEWCVLTATTGWHVPDGVRVEPVPPVEQLRLRSDCRQLEIDPLMEAWWECTFGAQSVRAVIFRVCWDPRLGEARGYQHWQRGFEEWSTYGAFDDHGRPRLVRIGQDEL